MQVTILGSGSSGNAMLVSSGHTRLLIDAGFSKRETLRRLAATGEPADSVQAILISHEHADHVQGLLALAQEWNARVYLTPGAREALGWAEALPRVETFRSGERFPIGDIEVTSFLTPHDAAEPVGFTFQAEGLKTALVTDIGFITELIKQQIRGADCLIIESNHDLEMLRHGPYPWFVKQRVLSRLGHLSNLELGRFLEEDYDGVARYLILAHISENNNHPEIARMNAAEAVARRQARFPLSLPHSAELLLTSQRTPLGPIRL
ncbi:MAG: MBL fold metallo-hydrolase [Terriglobia bacterium]